MNNLAILYYENNVNKDTALELIYTIRETDRFVSNIILLEIWNGIFNDVENKIIIEIREDYNDLEWYLEQLLIHQQKSLVLQLFKNPEFGLSLQEKYSVLHYVTLLLNEHQDENLLLKIPPELQSTIDEVIANIEEKEHFYGYK